MDEEKRKRLEAAGYVSVTVAEFLGLTPEQSELIEIKLNLTYALQQQRKISGLSQAELAEKIHSSQSRVAKIEAGDPHVSLDLMIRALLATGMTRGELAAVITGPSTQISGAEDQSTTSKSNGTVKKRATRAQKPQAVEA
ncbi:MAG: helix-turn-helix domain-containing protein [Janthinobacterium lividum]